MKKIIYTCLTLLIACPLAAHTLHEQITNAVSRALTHAPAVKVHVKLTKPIRMSDVMFRRPRGKDMIIDWKQKENNCTGTLRTDLQRVYVPAACVQEEKYQITQVKITLPNGRKLQTSAQAVHIVKKQAFITLR